MANSSESNVKNYLISDDTSEQFDNITTFAKNMTLKDSKYYEQGEDKISRRFGELLLKYYNYGLTYDEVAELLTFVATYNNTVGEIKDNPETKLKLFGLHKSQNYDESVISYLAKKLQFDYNKEDNLVFDNANKIIETYLIKKAGIEIDNTTNIPTYTKIEKIETDPGDTTKTIEFLNINFSDGDLVYFYNPNDNGNNNLFKFNNGSFTNINDSNESINYVLNNDGAKAEFKIRVCGITCTLQIVKKDEKILFRIIPFDDENSSDELKFDFDNYLKIMQKKELIQVKADADIERKVEKLKASEMEKSLAEQGELLNIFDLVLKTNIIDLYFSTLGENGETRHKEDDVSNTVWDKFFIKVYRINDENYYSIQILYKELNPLYRELLNSEIIESVLAQPVAGTSSGNDDTIFSKILFSQSTKENLINYPFMKYIRNNDVRTEILPTVDDYKDIDGNIVTTTKLYKYQYTNAYMARYANESDIISFYYGDYYISNGYGRYQYEQLEISDFISIFKQTREYFYKVLLNESFINEDEYSLYEKTFLIYVAIERFITNKLENLKDIDSFNKTDIKNFLTSYGFGDLAEIIDKRDFFESEIFSKRLIKNYINLVSNKGSRKVIDVLEDVFSIANGTLTIYKALLIKRVDANTNKYSYSVSKVKYNSTNIIEEIRTSLSTSTEFESFISSDKYWNINNTKKDYLDKIDFHVANTKYLVPEYNVEISAAYVTLRYILAVIDYMYERDKNKIVLGELKINGETLDDHIQNIKNNYYQYLNLKNGNAPGTLENLSIVYEIDDNAVAKYFNKYINLSITGDDRNIVTVKVKRDEILKEINQSYSLDNDIEMVSLALHSLMPIFIFYENRDDNGNIDDEKRNNIIKYLFKYADASDNNNGRITFAIFTKILNNMFNLLTMITSGAFFNRNLSGETINFILDMFNSIFKVKSIELTDGKHIKTDIMIKENDSATDVKSNEAECAEVVTNGIYELGKQISKDLSIQIQDNQNSLLDFLETCLEYFISYTSEIYNTKLEVSYDDKNEYVGPDDGIRMEISDIFVDSFYYDEELKITKTDIFVDSFYYDEKLKITETVTEEGTNA